MEAFFADVATIKSIIGEIRKKLVKLNKLNDEAKTATRTETMKRYRDEMNGVIETVSTTARECVLRLENLDRSNDTAVKGADSGPGSSQERTRTTITSSLKMKLKQQMAEFQDLRARLQSEYREVGGAQVLRGHGGNGGREDAGPPHRDGRVGDDFPKGDDGTGTRADSRHRGGDSGAPRCRPGVGAESFWSCIRFSST
jgi:syntaxin 1B/2/3